MSYITMQGEDYNPLELFLRCGHTHAPPTVSSYTICVQPSPKYPSGFWCVHVSKVCEIELIGTSLSSFNFLVFSTKEKSAVEYSFAKLLPGAVRSHKSCVAVEPSNSLIILKL
nr:hypothetical protein [Rubber tree latent virus 1]